MKKFSFPGGIHPLKDAHEGKKATKSQKVTALIPEVVYIPLDMHLGCPSVACVSKGARVKLGQLIAKADGTRGLSVHASVSGEVIFVGTKQMLGKFPSPCIGIKNDRQDEWVEDLPALGDVEKASPQMIIPAVEAAGVCGMGGACFPTYAKMQIQPDKSVDTLIINGAECETFLTSDERLMIESPERVVDGLRAAMRAMDVKRGIIAIEDNKPEAIVAIRKAAENRIGVEVAVLKTKYPQGGEKQLIQAVLGRQVPSGKLPADAHVVVFNVGTASAIADAVRYGRPLIERIVTITGCVKQASNLLIRIGTSIKEAVDACGGYAEEPGKIFVGGSMTGICVPNDQVSITKANNGIVILNPKDSILAEETACIRCGRCIDACPTKLNPYKLKNICDQMDLEQAKQNHVLDCINCGACSYVCPAKRRLSASFKEAKELITIRRA